MTLDSLLDHLITNGFVRRQNYVREPKNRCDWYAWRQLSASAVPSLGDNKPPRILVYGYRFEGGLHGFRESVEILICGLRGVGTEWRGPWFKLRACAVTPAEAARDLPAIEAALVRAWNALNPEQTHA